MKTIITMLAAMLAGTASYGENMPPLARTFACPACHAIDKQVVGPAWRDVANKYRNISTDMHSDNAYSLEDGLVRKVSLGGKGIWGDQIMAGNDTEGKRQDDIRTLVRFILALPPEAQP